MISSGMAANPTTRTYPSTLLEEDLASRAAEALDRTLRWSRQRDFTGWSKHDALNSPLLDAMLGGSRFGRLLAIQAVMRAPFNSRPLLGVRQARNSKGIALFAQAYLDRHAVHGSPADLDAATTLLDWLLEHPASGYRGLSWGYPYPWQDVGFFAPRHSPNRVVTCWIGLAFVEAARRTRERRYLDALPAIVEFLTGEPRVLEDTQHAKCYSYVPDETVTWAVMDVPALMGAFLAEAGAACGQVEWLDEARRLVCWTAEKQTDYGAWHYTHPPGDSHITHDNYHTAIILDCLDRYRVATGDERFDAAYWRGLEFYRRHLFDRQWAPRWMSDREYPHDAHGAASAILCFRRAAQRDPRYVEALDGTVRWALGRLYDRRGFFYYQETRWYRKRFTLMRWCNGWMSWALASALCGREVQ